MSPTIMCSQNRAGPLCRRLSAAAARRCGLFQRHDFPHVGAADRAFANGIAGPPDGSHLYVADSHRAPADRRFSREPFHRRPDRGRLTVDFRRAWTISLSTRRAICGSPAIPSCSRWRAFARRSVEAVAVGGLPGQRWRTECRKATHVFADDGSEIGAASVGAVSGDKLLIGSVLDNNLDCSGNAEPMRRISVTAKRAPQRAPFSNAPVMKIVMRRLTDLVASLRIAQHIAAAPDGLDVIVAVRSPPPASCAACR